MTNRCMRSLILSFIFAMAFSVNLYAEGYGSGHKAVESGAEYVITPFDAKNISPESLKKNEKFLDGNIGTAQIIDTVKGYETVIDFKKPKYIGLLGIRPGAYVNWSYPKDVELTIDGKKKIKVAFPEPINDIPTTVTTKIDQKVSSLQLKILDTYSKGKDRWGGLCAIGEAYRAPIVYSFAADPVDTTDKEFVFEIDSQEGCKAPVEILVGPNLFYKHPDLDIKKGRNKYTIFFDKFTPLRPYGFEFGPENIRAITIGFTDKDNDMSLVSVEKVASGEEPNEWHDMTPVKRETKKIDGKVWTKSLVSEGAGRFANSTYNGLLVETVTEYKFDSNTSGPEDFWRRQNFYFDIKGLNKKEESYSDKPWFLKVSGSEDGETINVSWAAMIRNRKLENGGKLKMICGAMVPGFIFDSTEDITIASSGGKIPRRTGFANETEKRFLVNEEKTVGSCGPGMVITSDGIFEEPGSVDFSKLSQPWAVAVWGGLKTPTFWGDEAVALLITAENGTLKWNKEGICIPKGVSGFSTAFQGYLNKNWKPESLRERALTLTKLLRTYPVKCDEWYIVSENKVNIRDEFSYYRWGSPKWQMKDYSPLPTLMVWAQKSIGWPDMPKATSPVIDTPLGPYSWVDGSDVEYTIPLFAPKFAAFPANDKYKDAQEKLSQYVLNHKEPTANDMNDHPDAWCAIYASMQWPAALIGGSVMNDDARERLYKIGKKALARGISSRSWYKRKELFSGKEYVASCWPDTTISPAMFGDTSSCVGTSLYALYLYAKYSGDWELVKEYWPRVMDIIRYGEVISDWAIPILSSRESVLFGGIDMDTISFSGLAGAQKMAETLGYKEDRDRIAYLRARQYITLLVRMNFQDYLDPQRKYPNIWVNGFCETGPCLEVIKGPNDPEALDKSAMMLCWQGQEPENYQFLIEAMPKDFLRKYEAEFVDKYISSPDGKIGWRRMGFNQPRTAAHIAARAWVKDWPADDIQKECKDWVEFYPDAVSSFNAGMWAVAWGHEDGVYLMDWQPAKLGNMYYDSKSKLLDINVECDKAFTIRLHSPRAIKSVELADGKTAEFKQESRDVYVIEMPKYSGKVKVQFKDEKK